MACFRLDFFVSWLEISCDQHDSEMCNTSYAMAVQFLDYPLILIHGQSCHNGLAFPTGKTCVVQADAEELDFLLRKV